MDKPDYVFAQAKRSSLKGFAWLPIPIFIILIVILELSPYKVVWNPPYMITTLNIIFLGIIPLFVSILAARTFLLKNSLPLLFIGCATLALGLGAILSGFSLLGKHINLTISIYNTSACLSGLFNLIAVYLYIKEVQLKPKQSWLYLLIAYSIIFILISILSLLIQNHIWPVHFIQGSGATLFGLIIIYTTILFYAISAIVIMDTKTDDMANFMYWYFLGLGLIAVGLFGVSIQTSMGDAQNWLGRTSQYLGAVYLLIAVVSTIRQTGVWMLPVEKALQETEERYTSLFNNMNEGMALHELVYDENGKIVDYIIKDVNPAYSEILPFKKEDIVGKKASLVYGTGSAPYIEIYSRIAQTGESESFEDYFEPLKKHIRISAFSAKKGEFATVFSDITENKKIEKELRESRDLLEEKVEERTRELSKERKLLKETIVELERSNQELESFAYITSHDLQEPLRTIASYAQLIQRRYEGKLDSDADEFIDYMISGSKRMKQQINGLLEYSRVGTRGGEFEKFNANEAVDEALSNLKSAIDECNAQITVDPLPYIMADKDQIVSVFQNLIVNAIKFSEEDVTPRIHISAQKQDDEYVFSVQDNGIGIESQYCDQIFEVFKRLHAIGQYGGTGIGLAIVKRIVDRHGGRVWVESEFGKGSTFYFSISNNFSYS